MSDHVSASGLLSATRTFYCRPAYSRCGHYIFALWFLLSFFLSSPNLSRRRLDVCHGVALVQIKGSGLKRAARGYLKMQDSKNRLQFAIWPPSHNFVGIYN